MKSSVTNNAPRVAVMVFAFLLLAVTAFPANIWFVVTNQATMQPDTNSILIRASAFSAADGSYHSAGTPFRVFPPCTNVMGPGVYLATNPFICAGFFGPGQPGTSQGFIFYVDPSTNTYSFTRYPLSGYGIQNFYTGITGIVGTNGILVYSNYSSSTVTIDGSGISASVSSNSITNALGYAPVSPVQLAAGTNAALGAVQASNALQSAALALGTNAAFGAATNYANTNTSSLFSTSTNYAGTNGSQLFAASTNYAGTNVSSLFAASTNFAGTFAKASTNGLGSAAFYGTNTFDLAGAAAQKAQQATNGLAQSAFVPTNTFDLQGQALNATSHLAGLSAFYPTNTFDLAGAGNQAALNATNGLPSGAFSSAFTLTNGVVRSNSVSGATTGLVPMSTNVAPGYVWAALPTSSGSTNGFPTNYTGVVYLPGQTNLNVWQLSAGLTLVTNLIFTNSAQVCTVAGNAAMLATNLLPFGSGGTGISANYSGAVYFTNLSNFIAANALQGGTLVVTNVFINFAGAHPTANFIGTYGVADSLILGGNNNDIYVTGSGGVIYDEILGGNNNVIDENFYGSSNSIIVGGEFNEIGISFGNIWPTYGSVILGGYSNQLSQSYSTAIGIMAQSKYPNTFIQNDGSQGIMFATNDHTATLIDSNGVYLIGANVGPFVNGTNLYLLLINLTAVISTNWINSTNYANTNATAAALKATNGLASAAFANTNQFDLAGRATAATNGMNLPNIANAITNGQGLVTAGAITTYSNGVDGPQGQTTLLDNQDVPPDSQYFLAVKPAQGGTPFDYFETANAAYATLWCDAYTNVFMALRPSLPNTPGSNAFFGYFNGDISQGTNLSVNNIAPGNLTNSINLVGIDGGGAGGAAGTYLRISTTAFTNLDANLFGILTNSGFCYIQSNQVTLYTASSLQGPWSLVNGANPVPTSRTGQNWDLNGIVFSGFLNSTDLIAKITAIAGTNLFSFSTNYANTNATAQVNQATNVMLTAVAANFAASVASNTLALMLITNTRAYLPYVYSPSNNLVPDNVFVFTNLQTAINRYCTSNYLGGTITLGLGEFYYPGGLSFPTNANYVLRITGQYGGASRIVCDSNCFVYNGLGLSQIEPSFTIDNCAILTKSNQNAGFVFQLLGGQRHEVRDCYIGRWQYLTRTNNEWFWAPYYTNASAICVGVLSSDNYNIFENNKVSGLGAGLLTLGDHFRCYHNMWAGIADFYTPANAPTSETRSNLWSPSDTGTIANGQYSLPTCYLSAGAAYFMCDNGDAKIEDDYVFNSKAGVFFTTQNLIQNQYGHDILDTVKFEDTGYPLIADDGNYNILSPESLPPVELRSCSYFGDITPQLYSCLTEYLYSQQATAPYLCFITNNNSANPNVQYVYHSHAFDSNSIINFVVDRGSQTSSTGWQTVESLDNVNSVFSLVGGYNFTGGASGLSNLPAAKLTGTAPLSVIPSAVVTTNFSGPLAFTNTANQFNGSFVNPGGYVRKEINILANVGAIQTTWPPWMSAVATSIPMTPGQFGIWSFNVRDFAVAGFTNLVITAAIATSNAAPVLNNWELGFVTNGLNGNFAGNYAVGPNNLPGYGLASNLSYISLTNEVPNSILTNGSGGVIAIYNNSTNTYWLMGLTITNHP